MFLFLTVIENEGQEPGLLKAPELASDKARDHKATVIYAA